MHLIDQNKDQLRRLCEMHGVRELYLFGSILTNKFNEGSDIDLLIQFHQIKLSEYFDNYMDMKEGLEVLFKRRIDLVEVQTIHNPIFLRIIERDKFLIYERKTA